MGTYLRIIFFFSSLIACLCVAEAQTKTAPSPYSQKEEKESWENVIDGMKALNQKTCEKAEKKLDAPLEPKEIVFECSVPGEDGKPKLMEFTFNFSANPGDPRSMEFPQKYESMEAKGKVELADGVSLGVSAGKDLYLRSAPPLIFFDPGILNANGNGGI